MTVLQVATFPVDCITNNKLIMNENVLEFKCSSYVSNVLMPICMVLSRKRHIIIWKLLRNNRAMLDISLRIYRNRERERARLEDMCS